jgi:integrase
MTMRSQQDRRRSKPGKFPGERYTVDSYRRAVKFGIKAVNREAERNKTRAIPHWHPHQLRHSVATRLEREFNSDVARAVLGHPSPVVTAPYSERDGAKAAEAMERDG